MPTKYLMTHIFILYPFFPRLFKLFLLNTSSTWHTFLPTCLSNSSFYRYISKAGLYTLLKDLKESLYD